MTCSTTTVAGLDQSDAAVPRTNVYGRRPGHHIGFPEILRIAGQVPACHAGTATLISAWKVKNLSRRCVTDV